MKITPRQALGSLILAIGIGVLLYSSKREEDGSGTRKTNRNIGIVGAIIMAIGAIILFVKFN